jgi:hypothetical protein
VVTLHDYGFLNQLLLPRGEHRVVAVSETDAPKTLLVFMNPRSDESDARYVPRVDINCLVDAHDTLNFFVI